MESSSANIIAAGIGVAGFIMALVGLGVQLGKLTSRAEENSKDINKLGVKVEDNRKSSFKHFVTKNHCDGVNKNWKTFISGVIKEGNLTTEHIKESLGRLEGAIADGRGETNDRLEGIDRCLKKVQKNLQCE